MLKKWNSETGKGQENYVLLKYRVPKSYCPKAISFVSIAQKRSFQKVYFAC